jgi:hypothetical protein
MYRPSLEENVAENCSAKAALWGSAVAGAVLMGPLGIVVGAAAAAAIICSGSSDDSSASDASQANENKAGSPP